MLSFPGTIRVFLAREPVDFRKAHDGLCAVVRQQLGSDPFTGDVFVFLNRARNRIKLLLWDRTGFWLFYKRLEKGTFSFDLHGSGSRLELTRAQLAMILEGIDWKSAKLRPHFADPVRIKGRQGESSGEGRRQLAHR
ncbi:MAG TPA: IS66 family insertion sequence element accessory protein TnpB [Longimicrobiales bacterium]|nr:IS66 family insertion sequence element accessory protein TnpB [Longimicrobiales bacterium]